MLYGGKNFTVVVFCLFLCMLLFPFSKISCAEGDIADSESVKASVVKEVKITGLQTVS